MDQGGAYDKDLFDPRFEDPIWEGVTGMPKIIDQKGQDAVIERIATQFKDAQGKTLKLTKTRTKQIRENINEAKQNLITAKQYREQASGEIEELTAKIYDVYDDTIHSENTLDFHDNLLGMIKLWTEEPETLKAFQEYYQEGHIFGDEIQDLSTLQLEWLKMLAGGPGARLTVAGDVRQRILNFNDPSKETPIDTILDWHPAAQVKELTQNYRSTSSIISLANKILEGDQNIPQMDIKAMKGDSGLKPLHYVAETTDEEIAWVVNQAKQLVEDQGHDLSDIAIFARTHEEIAKFHEGFRKAGLASKLMSAKSIFEETEVKGLLDFLGVLRDPTSNSQLLNVLGTSKGVKGVGPETIKNITQLASQLTNEEGRPGVSFWEALKRVKEAPSTAPDLKFNRAQENAIENFVNFVENFDDRDRSLSEGLDYILRNTPFAEKMDANRKANIQKIQADIKQFEKSVSGEKEEGERVTVATDLGRYLEQVYERERDAVEEDLNEDVIRLMTMHAGKGLEYPVVFSTGLHEGSVPYERADRQEDITRERQTFFVTATRAEQQLYLTRSGKKMAPDPYSPEANWQEVDLQQSRFLDDLEAGQDYTLVGKDYRAVREGGQTSKTVRAIRAQSIRDMAEENKQLGIYQEQREAVIQDLDARTHEVGQYFQELGVKERVTFLERALESGVAPEMLEADLGVNADRIKLAFANALHRYSQTITDYSQKIADLVDDEAEKEAQEIADLEAEIERLMAEIDDEEKKAKAPSTSKGASGKAPSELIGDSDAKRALLEQKRKELEARRQALADRDDEAEAEEAAEKTIYESLEDVKRAHEADPLTHVAPQGMGRKAETEWQDRETPEEKEEARKRREQQKQAAKDQKKAPQPSAPPSPPPSQPQAPSSTPPDDDDDDKKAAKDSGKALSGLAKILAAIDSTDLGDLGDLGEQLKGGIKQLVSAVVGSVDVAEDEDEKKAAEAKKPDKKEAAAPPEKEKKKRGRPRKDPDAEKEIKPTPGVFDGYRPFYLTVKQLMKNDELLAQLTEDITTTEQNPDDNRALLDDLKKERDQAQKEEDTLVSRLAAEMFGAGVQRKLFASDRDAYMIEVDDIRRATEKLITEDPYEGKLADEKVKKEEDRVSQNIYELKKQDFQRIAEKEVATEQLDGIAPRVKANAKEIYELARSLLKRSGKAPKQEGKWLENLSRTFEFLAEYSTRDTRLGQNISLAFDELTSLGKEAVESTTTDHLLGITQLFKPLFNEVTAEWDELAGPEKHDSILKNIGQAMGNLLEKERSRKVKQVAAKLQKDKDDGKTLSLRAEQFLAAAALNESNIERIYKDLSTAPRERVLEMRDAAEQRLGVSSEFIRAIEGNATQNEALSQEIEELQKGDDKIEEPTPFDRVNKRQDLIPALIDATFSESQRIALASQGRRLEILVEQMADLSNNSKIKETLRKQAERFRNRTITALHKSHPSLSQFRLTDEPEYDRHIERFFEDVDSYIDSIMGDDGVLDFSTLTQIAPEDDVTREKYPAQMRLRDIQTWIDNAKKLTDQEKSYIKTFGTEIDHKFLAEAFGLDPEYIQALQKGDKEKDAFVSLAAKQQEAAEAATRERKSSVGELKEETAALNENTRAQDRNAKARKGNTGGRRQPNLEDEIRNAAQQHVIERFEESRRLRRETPPTHTIKNIRMTPDRARAGARFETADVFDFTEFVESNQMADLLDNAYKLLVEGTDDSLGRARNILKNIYDQNVMPIRVTEGLTQDLFNNLYEKIGSGKHEEAQNEIKQLLDTVTPQTEYGKGAFKRLSDISSQLEKDQPDIDQAKELFKELVKYARDPGRKEFLEDLTSLQALFEIRERNMTRGGERFVSHYQFSAFRDRSNLADDDLAAVEDYERRMQQMAEDIARNDSYKMSARELYQKYGESDVPYDQFFERMKAMADDPRSLIRYENRGGIDIFRSLLTRKKGGRPRALTFEKAREIAFRLEKGESQSRLGIDYGVNVATIDKVAKRTYGDGGGAFQYQWTKEEQDEISIAQAERQKERNEQMASNEEMKKIKKERARRKAAVESVQKKIRDTYKALKDLNARAAALKQIRIQIETREKDGRDVTDALNESNLAQQDVASQIETAEKSIAGKSAQLKKHGEDVPDEPRKWRGFSYAEETARLIRMLQISGETAEDIEKTTGVNKEHQSLIRAATGGYAGYDLTFSAELIKDIEDYGVIRKDIEKAEKKRLKREKLREEAEARRRLRADRDPQSKQREEHLLSVGDQIKKRIENYPDIFESVFGAETSIKNYQGPRLRAQIDRRRKNIKEPEIPEVLKDHKDLIKLERDLQDAVDIYPKRVQDFITQMLDFAHRFQMTPEESRGPSYNQMDEITRVTGLDELVLQQFMHSNLSQWTPESLLATLTPEGFDTEYAELKAAADSVSAFLSEKTTGVLPDDQSGTKSVLSNYHELINQTVEAFHKSKDQIADQLKRGDIDEDEADLMRKNIREDLFEGLANADRFKPDTGPAPTEQEIENQVKKVFDDLEKERDRLAEQVHQKTMSHEDFQTQMRAAAQVAKDEVRKLRGETVKPGRTDRIQKISDALIETDAALMPGMQRDYAGLANELKIDERLLRFISHDAELAAYDDDTLLSVLDQATPQLLNEIQTYENLKTAEADFKQGDRLLNVTTEALADRREEIQKLYDSEKEIFNQFPGLKAGVEAILNDTELTKQQREDFEKASGDLFEFSKVLPKIIPTTLSGKSHAGGFGRGTSPIRQMTADLYANQNRMGLPQFFIEESITRQGTGIFDRLTELFSAETYDLFRGENQEARIKLFRERVTTDLDRLESLSDEHESTIIDFSGLRLGVKAALAEKPLGEEDRRRYGEAFRKFNEFVQHIPEYRKQVQNYGLKRAFKWLNDQFSFMDPDNIEKYLMDDPGNEAVILKDLQGNDEFFRDLESLRESLASRGMRWKKVDPESTLMFDELEELHRLIDPQNIDFLRTAKHIENVHDEVLADVLGFSDDALRATDDEGHPHFPRIKAMLEGKRSLPTKYGETDSQIRYGKQILDERRELKLLLDIKKRIEADPDYTVKDAAEEYLVDEGKLQNIVDTENLRIEQLPKLLSPEGHHLLGQLKSLDAQRSMPEQRKAELRDFQKRRQELYTRYEQTFNSALRSIAIITDYYHKIMKGEFTDDESSREFLAEQGGFDVELFELFKDADPFELEAAFLSPRTHDKEGPIMASENFPKVFRDQLKDLEVKMQASDEELRSKFPKLAFRLSGERVRPDTLSDEEDAEYRLPVSYDERDAFQIKLWHRLGTKISELANIYGLEEGIVRKIVKDPHTEGVAVPKLTKGFRRISATGQVEDEEVSHPPRTALAEEADFTVRKGEDPLGEVSFDRYQAVVRERYREIQDRIDRKEAEAAAEADKKRKELEDAQDLDKIIADTENELSNILAEMAKLQAKIEAEEKAEKAKAKAPETPKGASGRSPKAPGKLIGDSDADRARLEELAKRAEELQKNLDLAKKAQADKVKADKEAAEKQAAADAAATTADDGVPITGGPSKRFQDISWLDQNQQDVIGKVSDSARSMTPQQVVIARGLIYLNKKLEGKVSKKVLAEQVSQAIGREIGISTISNLEKGESYKGVRPLTDAEKATLDAIAEKENIKFIEQQKKDMATKKQEEKEKKPTWRGKLTAEQVTEIRRHGAQDLLSRKEIGEMYGINPASVSQIIGDTAAKQSYQQVPDLPIEEKQRLYDEATPERNRIAQEKRDAKAAAEQARKEKQQIEKEAKKMADQAASGEVPKRGKRTRLQEVLHEKSFTEEQKSTYQHLTKRSEEIRKELLRVEKEILDLQERNKGLSESELKSHEEKLNKQKDLILQEALLDAEALNIKKQRVQLTRDDLREIREGEDRLKETQSRFTELENQYRSLILSKLTGDDQTQYETLLGNLDQSRSDLVEINQKIAEVEEKSFKLSDEDQKDLKDNQEKLKRYRRQRAESQEAITKIEAERRNREESFEMAERDLAEFRGTHAPTGDEVSEFQNIQSKVLSTKKSLEGLQEELKELKDKDDQATDGEKARIALLVDRIKDQEQRLARFGVEYEGLEHVKHGLGTLTEAEKEDLTTLEERAKTTRTRRDEYDAEGQIQEHQKAIKEAQEQEANIRDDITGILSEKAGILGEDNDELKSLYERRSQAEEAEVQATEQIADLESSKLNLSQKDEDRRQRHAQEIEKIEEERVKISGELNELKKKEKKLTIDQQRRLESLEGKSDKELERLRAEARRKDPDITDEALSLIESPDQKRLREEWRRKDKDITNEEILRREAELQKGEIQLIRERRTALEQELSVLDQRKSGLPRLEEQELAQKVTERTKLEKESDFVERQLVDLVGGKTGIEDVAQRRTAKSLLRIAQARTEIIRIKDELQVVGDDEKREKILQEEYQKAIFALNQAISENISMNEQSVQGSQSILDDIRETEANYEDKKENLKQTQKNLIARVITAGEQKKRQKAIDARLKEIDKEFGDEVRRLRNEYEQADLQGLKDRLTKLHADLRADKQDPEKSQEVLDLRERIADIEEKRGIKAAELKRDVDRYEAQYPELILSDPKTEGRRVYDKYADSFRERSRKIESEFDQKIEDANQELKRLTVDIYNQFGKQVEEAQKVLSDELHKVQKRADRILRKQGIDETSDKYTEIRNQLIKNLEEPINKAYDTSIATIDQAVGNALRVARQGTKIDQYISERDVKIADEQAELRSEYQKAIEMIRHQTPEGQREIRETLKQLEKELYELQVREIQDEGTPRREVEDKYQKEISKLDEKLEKEYGPKEEIIEGRFKFEVNKAREGIRETIGKINEDFDKQIEDLEESHKKRLDNVHESILQSEVAQGREQYLTPERTQELVDKRTKKYEAEYERRKKGIEDARERQLELADREDPETYRSVMRATEERDKDLERVRGQRERTRAGGKIRIEGRRTRRLRRLEKPRREILRVSDALQRMEGEIHDAYYLFRQLATGMIQAAGDMEAFDYSLRATAGSAEKAKARLKDLIEIAKEPGLTIQSTAKGAVVLDALGLTPELTNQVLKEFGNVIGLIGGADDEMRRSLLGLTQIVSKGQVLAEEINQMREISGLFSVGLENVFGTQSSEAISEMVGTGKRAVIEGFVRPLISELGRLERAGVTGFINQWKNFQDSLFKIKASLGEILLDPVRYLLEAFTAIFDTVKNLNDVLRGGIGDFIVTLTGFFALAAGARWISEIFDNLPSLVSGFATATRSFSDALDKRSAMKQAVKSGAAFDADKFIPKRGKFIKRLDLIGKKIQSFGPLLGVGLVAGVTVGLTALFWLIREYNRWWNEKNKMVRSLKEYQEGLASARTFGEWERTVRKRRNDLDLETRKRREKLGLTQSIQIPETPEEFHEVTTEKTKSYKGGMIRPYRRNTLIKELESLRKLTDERNKLTGTLNLFDRVHGGQEVARQYFTDEMKIHRAREEEVKKKRDAAQMVLKDLQSDDEEVRRKHIKRIGLGYGLMAARSEAQLSLKEANKELDQIVRESLQFNLVFADWEFNLERFAKLAQNLELQILKIEAGIEKINRDVADMALTFVSNIEQPDIDFKTLIKKPTLLSGYQMIEEYLKAGPKIIEEIRKARDLEIEDLEDPFRVYRSQLRDTTLDYMSNINNLITEHQKEKFKIESKVKMLRSDDMNLGLTFGDFQNALILNRTGFYVPEGPDSTNYIRYNRDNIDELDESKLTKAGKAALKRFKEHKAAYDRLTNPQKLALDQLVEDFKDQQSPQFDNIQTKLLKRLSAAKMAYSEGFNEYEVSKFQISKDADDKEREQAREQAAAIFELRKRMWDELIQLEQDQLDLRNQRQDQAFEKLTNIYSRNLEKIKRITERATEDLGELSSKLLESPQGRGEQVLLRQYKEISNLTKEIRKNAIRTEQSNIEKEIEREEGIVQNRIQNEEKRLVNNQITNLMRDLDSSRVDYIQRENLPAEISEFITAYRNIGATRDDAIKNLDLSPEEIGTNREAQSIIKDTRDKQRKLIEQWLPYIRELDPSLAIELPLAMSEFINIFKDSESKLHESAMKVSDLEHQLENLGFELTDLEREYLKELIKWKDDLRERTKTAFRTLRDRDISDRIERTDKDFDKITERISYLDLSGIGLSEGTTKKSIEKLLQTSSIKGLYQVSSQDLLGIDQLETIESDLEKLAQRYLVDIKRRYQAVSKDIIDNTKLTDDERIVEEEIASRNYLKEIEDTKKKFKDLSKGISRDLSQVLNDNLRKLLDYYNRMLQAQEKSAQIGRDIQRNFLDEISGKEYKLPFISEFSPFLGHGGIKKQFEERAKASIAAANLEIESLETEYNNLRDKFIMDLSETENEEIKTVLYNLFKEEATVIDNQIKQIKSQTKSNLRDLAKSAAQELLSGRDLIGRALQDFSSSLWESFWTLPRAAKEALKELDESEKERLKELNEEAELSAKERAEKIEEIEKDSARRRLEIETQLASDRKRVFADVVKSFISGIGEVVMATITAKIGEHITNKLLEWVPWLKTPTKEELFGDMLQKTLIDVASEFFEPREEEGFLAKAAKLITGIKEDPGFIASQLKKIEEASSIRALIIETHKSNFKFEKAVNRFGMIISFFSNIIKELFDKAEAEIPELKEQNIRVGRKVAKVAEDEANRKIEKIENEMIKEKSEIESKSSENQEELIKISETGDRGNIELNPFTPNAAAIGMLKGILELEKMQRTSSGLSGIQEIHRQSILKILTSYLEDPARFSTGIFDNTENSEEVFNQGIIDLLEGPSEIFKQGIIKLLEEPSEIFRRGIIKLVESPVHFKERPTFGEAIGNTENYLQSIIGHSGDQWTRIKSRKVDLDPARLAYLKTLLEWEKMQRTSLGVGIQEMQRRGMLKILTSYLEDPEKLKEGIFDNIINKEEIFEQGIIDLLEIRSKFFEQGVNNLLKRKSEIFSKSPINFTPKEEMINTIRDMKKYVESRPSYGDAIGNTDNYLEHLIGHYLDDSTQKTYDEMPSGGHDPNVIQFLTSDDLLSRPTVMGESHLQDNKSIMRSVLPMRFASGGKTGDPTKTTTPTAKKKGPWKIPTTRAGLLKLVQDGVSEEASDEEKKFFNFYEKWKSVTIASERDSDWAHEDVAENKLWLVGYGHNLTGAKEKQQMMTDLGIDTLDTGPLWSEIRARIIKLGKKEIMRMFPGKKGREVWKQRAPGGYHSPWIIDHATLSKLFPNKSITKLTDEMRQQIGNYWLERDFSKHYQLTDTFLAELQPGLLQFLSGSRGAGVIDRSFQSGITGFKGMRRGLKKYFEGGSLNDAIYEMWNSKNYRQTPTRMQKSMALLLSGKWPDEEGYDLALETVQSLVPLFSERKKPKKRTKKETMALIEAKLTDYAITSGQLTSQQALEPGKPPEFKRRIGKIAYPAEHPHAVEYPDAILDSIQQQVDADTKKISEILQRRWTDSGIIDFKKASGDISKLLEVYPNSLERNLGSKKMEEIIQIIQTGKFPEANKSLVRDFAEQFQRILIEGVATTGKLPDLAAILGAEEPELESRIYQKQIDYIRSSQPAIDIPVVSEPMYRLAKSIENLTDKVDQNTKAIQQRINPFGDRSDEVPPISELNIKSETILPPQTGSSNFLEQALSQKGSSTISKSDFTIIDFMSSITGADLGGLSFTSIGELATGPGSASNKAGNLMLSLFGKAAPGAQKLASLLGTTGGQAVLGTGLGTGLIQLFKSDLFEEGFGDLMNFVMGDTDLGERSPHKFSPHRLPEWLEKSTDWGFGTMNQLFADLGYGMEQAMNFSVFDSEANDFLARKAGARFGKKVLNESATKLGKRSARDILEHFERGAESQMGKEKPQQPTSQKIVLENYIQVGDEVIQAMNKREVELFSENRLHRI